MKMMVSFSSEAFLIECRELFALLGFCVFGAPRQSQLNKKTPHSCDADEEPDSHICWNMARTAESNAAKEMHAYTARSFYTNKDTCFYMGP